MQRQQEDLLKGLGITAVGAYGIYWSMTQPCSVAPNPMVGLTTEMARLMCLTLDWKLTIVLLIASVAIVSGAGRVFKNI